MDHIPRYHGWLLNCSVLTSCSESSRCGIHLKADDGQVCTQGGWTRGKGGFWSNCAGGGGGNNRGGGSRYVSLVGAAILGGGRGVPPS